MDVGTPILSMYLSSAKDYSFLKFLLFLHHFFKMITFSLVCSSNIIFARSLFATEAPSDRKYFLLPLFEWLASGFALLFY
jgi:hypothetical protein